MARGNMYLELHINWRTIKSYYVVSCIKYNEKFEDIKDAKEAFDYNYKRESEASNVAR